AVDLAAEYDDVYATVGLHPHDARNLHAEWDGIAALAGSDRVVAIGEAGFDLHYTHSPRAEQEDAFRRHVRLALELDRPQCCTARAYDRVVDVGEVAELTSANAARVFGVER